ncbi:LOW QUALITY PROTEIN: vomeronasal type-2 receptor 116-like [Dugong dugon]
MATLSYWVSETSPACPSPPFWAHTEAQRNRGASPFAQPEVRNLMQQDMNQSLKCPDHQYVNSEQKFCLQKAVTFLAYEDPLGMALACTALCFSVITAVVLWVFVKHRDTPIVKANNRALSYILLLSLLLCFLCSLLFIGCPNTATCILRQITFGVVFIVAVSTVLAKTISVILAFKATKPGRTMRNLITERSKGSVTAFCVLGYLGSLALGTFSLAYLARNLPDTFSEAKFLTFSMLVFCGVWVTFLPVYHSTKGTTAVEIFSILTSSVGLLGCIFAPKCYIILIKPDRNNVYGVERQILIGLNQKSSRLGKRVGLITSKPHLFYTVRKK